MDSTDEDTKVNDEIRWAGGPTPYDPERERRRFEEAVVGPDGETRAEARALILQSLSDLRDSVIEAQDNGTIEPVEAFKLRLQIHRERCALVGLSVAGSPW